MRIEERFVLDASPEATFEFLSEVDRVSQCVPGVEGLRRRDDGTYEAQLRAEVGPIRAVFAGSLELTPRPPAQLTARGRGRDRTSGSRVEVTFDARLSPLDGAQRTTVDSVADVTIRGRLGQFGTGVIRATATELIRDFVACANERVAADGDTDGDTGGVRSGAATPSGRLLWRVLVNLVRRWWRRLTGRDASDTGDC